jgi:3D (Asp-Asp-Asp) domain-containing protein
VTTFSSLAYHAGLDRRAVQERSWVIGRTFRSPFTATGVLSLGLLLPFGAGTFSDRALALVQNAAAETPAKHVTFIRSGDPVTVETRAATIDDLLIERGIVRAPEDIVSSDPSTPLADGAVISYRPALPVTLVVDNVERQLRTPAATVRELLAAQNVAFAAHDKVWPKADDALTSDSRIRVEHVTSWIEHVRRSIAPPVQRRYDFSLAAGTTRVIDPGARGTRELTLMVSQPDRRFSAKRSLLAARVVRAPRAKIIALGVGEYASFANMATRGLEGTIKLAHSALTMIATAYTANCYGCSGYTATGRRAGHGIVAVDPRVIPLGTHLYIPGYGHALAGDTGGAIRGNRIDLGFNSHGDAINFGRRPIVVYVLK